MFALWCGWWLDSSQNPSISFNRIHCFLYYLLEKSKLKLACSYWKVLKLPLVPAEMRFSSSLRRLVTVSFSSLSSVSSWPRCSLCCFSPCMVLFSSPDSTCSLLSVCTTSFLQKQYSTIYKEEVIIIPCWLWRYSEGGSTFNIQYVCRTLEFCIYQGSLLSYCDEACLIECISLRVNGGIFPFVCIQTYFYMCIQWM